MSLSLREQLLQAGLGSKKQAKQADYQSRQQNREQPRNKPAPPSPQQLAAQKAQAEKLARDQELNRKQQEKAQKKARRAQVRQVIEQNRIPKLESEDYYNFIDGKMIRRIAVTPMLREQLTCGDMVLVRYSGHYEVVPVAVVPRIKEIDEQVIVPYTSPVASADQPVDENDPYKDFVVPDDLTW
jgi:uncharacterized protein YaiL (DUF2058 family)